MKTYVSINRSGGRAPTGPAAAFTLPEILISIAVFMFVLSGILGANLFGLKLCQFTQIKLSATDEGRSAVGTLTDEIRNCSALWVGSITNGHFVGHLDGEPQTGSALMIYPTTNLADFVVYYVNSPDETFRRTTSAEGTTRVLAHSIANTSIFSVQDSRGNVSTNNQNSRVIHACLQFRQSHPGLPTADSYKLETSIARRAQ